ncbi:MAG: hypothetical protein ABIR35_09380, partial [Polaromonas sp.]
MTAISESKAISANVALLFSSHTRSRPRLPARSPLGGDCEDDWWKEQHLQDGNQADSESRYQRHLICVTPSVKQVNGNPFDRDP